MESIIEGNKLIAEFMGIEASIIKDFDDKNYLYDVKKSARINEAVVISYHSSWDWLMPVVIKIMYSDWAKEGETLSLNIQRELSFAVLEKIWLAIIQFIKWYNQNTKQ